MLRKINFRVVHVTSQDEKFPAKELNERSPSTKGWRSAKYCPFPQQIVIELESSAHIKKIQILSHQYLIASKVEFFIGDSWGNDTINMETSRFTRLGHIELSSNESTNFRARELKSVHVNATGSCFQIFLYKNYVNGQNPFNQIGVVALNFIGESSDNVHKAYEEPEASRHSCISPLDDLAFDVYQDPRLADILRRLQAQKLVYAREENFELARQARDAIKRLQVAGEQLFQLELEKQEAANVEDYERAKESKERIIAIREALAKEIDFHALLPSGPAVETVPERRQPAAALPALLRDAEEPFMLPTNQQYFNADGGNLHYKRNPWSPYDNSAEANLNGDHREDSEYSNESPYSSRRCYNQADERPLPTLAGRQGNNNAASGALTMVPARSLDSEGPATLSRLDLLTVDEEDKSYVEASDNHLHNDEHKRNTEFLSEENARQASVVIDVVGLPLVTKAYSKVWQNREEALRELERRVCGSDLPPPVALAGTSSEPDPSAELRSTTFLLRRALNDQVLIVFRNALHLINPAIVEFGERYELPKQEVLQCLEQLVPLIIHKTGETSVRLREAAKSFLLEMAQWPILRHGSAFWHELLRPFLATTLERLALSRVEIITELYASFGAAKLKSPAALYPPGGTGGGSSSSCGGLSSEDLITFTAQALEHRSNEVRELAESLMVAIYRAEDRHLVRRCLPPVEHKSRSQPLYRRLFSKFDRLDGRQPQPTTVVKTKPTASTNNTTNKSNPGNARGGIRKGAASVVAAPNPRNAKSVLSAGGAANGRPGPHQKSVGGTGVKSSKGPSNAVLAAADTAEIDMLLSLDKTCIFCGEQDEDFTEEALDLHYWKNCPMLRRCPNCKQVVEISSLTDHLLSECEPAKASGGYMRCPKCSEAVAKSSFSAHMAAATCRAARDPILRCPLCHADLVLGTVARSTPSAVEDAWKSHLMGTGEIGVSTCPQNTRTQKLPQQQYLPQQQWPSPKPQLNKGVPIDPLAANKKVFLNQVNVS